MIETVTAHYVEHPLFDSPSTMQRVWRYMDIAKFVSLLDTHALFFARADRVSDAWEGAYTIENVRRRPDVFGCGEQNGESSETLRCLSAFHRSMMLHTFLNCWHLSEIESAGMWQLYAPRDGGIAVQSTFDRLVRSFPNDDDGLFQVHIGTVNYINYDRDSIPDGNAFVPFLHKRKSFEHEHEVRAIIQPVFPGSEAITDSQPFADGILVEVDLSVLVDRIFVSPTSPQWFFELVGSISAKYCISAPIHRSDLERDPVY
jgi:hypothetical protein